MVQLPRKIRSPFSILLFIAYLGLSNPVFAQTALEQCVVGAFSEFMGLIKEVVQRPGITNSMMAVCPAWAALCSYFHRHCPREVTCTFTNYDPKITVKYDPNSPTSYTKFLYCTSCNVEGKCLPACSKL